MAAPNTEDTSRTLSSPTSLEERNPVIDILRGFALFGILLVNFPGSEASRSGTADDVVMKLLTILVSGKFYTTFSFLFGLGFALQFLRAQSRGRRIVPIYIRRLLVLFLIGFGHAVLIWQGDVLMIYAVMGLYLILLRKCPGKVLLLLAVLVLVGDYFVSISDKPFLVRDLVPRIVSPEMEQGGALRDAVAFSENREAWQRVWAATKSGTYLEAVAARFDAEIISSRYVFRYLWLSSFFMFLLGLYAGRSRLISCPPVRSVLIRRVMWISLPVWLGFGVLVSFGPQVLGSLYFKIHWKLLSLAWELHAPAGSLFYISAILSILALRPKWIARLSPLGAVGRMGLTNYLLQSILGTLLYYGYGLGLQLKLGNLTGLVLGLAVYALQIPLSVWWLRKFQFGPFEWLWRSLTYMRVQPFLAPKIKPAEA